MTTLLRLPNHPLGWDPKRAAALPVLFFLDRGSNSPNRPQAKGMRVPNVIRGGEAYITSGTEALTDPCLMGPQRNPSSMGFARVSQAGCER
jgi:hypothetical protein